MAADPVNSSDDSAERPIIRKIREMLEKTDPEKWQRYDEALDPERRFPKPRQSWERVYTLKIPKGTLTLRSSQSVKSDYLAGGFTLTPLSHERYTIELRGISWDPVLLVDPYVGGGGNVDKRCEVLAEGRIAQELFALIAGRIQVHVQNRFKNFSAAAEELLEVLQDRIPKMEYNMWQKREEKGSRSYTTSFDRTTICVGRDTKNGQEQYYSVCQRGDLTYRSQNYTLSKTLFEMIEKLEQDSGLMALSEALEEIS